VALVVRDLQAACPLQHWGRDQMHLSDIVLAGVVVGTILGAFVYLAV
jgi:hypothetical protein